MIVFIGAGLLLGGLLGARFTAMALVPAAVLSLSAAALACALVWVGHGGLPEWGLLHVLVLVVFLQVGYACSGGLRLFVAPLRGVPEGKTSGAKTVRASGPQAIE
jgi:hypothetical protein